MSLIELMVAITISLLIILALTTVFVNFSRTNREMAKSNAMIDNGRFAMQLLQNDIVHAGFWGSRAPEFDNFILTSDPPGDVPGDVPQACRVFDTSITDTEAAGYWKDDEKNNLVGIPVEVYEDVDDDMPSACAPILTNQVEGTDVLLVRHASTCVAGVGNCEADTAGKLYFQTSNCAANSSSYVLDHDGFGLKQRDCSTAADKRKFISNIYYVRDFANNAGDGIPTLVRSQFDVIGGTEIQQQEPVPIVEGIEGFRVELGIDNISEAGTAVNYLQAVSWNSSKTVVNNRGDGAPDGAFVSCTSLSPCTAAQLMNVTAVKIYVLARNLEATPGYTDPKKYYLAGTEYTPADDGFKRHLFVTTVRLANIAARRETP